MRNRKECFSLLFGSRSLSYPQIKSSVSIVRKGRRLIFLHQLDEIDSESVTKKKGQKEIDRKRRVGDERSFRCKSIGVKKDEEGGEGKRRREREFFIPFSLLSSPSSL